jgi:hypothetical protein
MTEFPPCAKAIPLKNPIVAVGIDSVKIEDKFTTDDQGNTIKEEYCRLATINIRLSIHVPFSMGGEACHENFTRIVDCLTFATDFNILESGCDCVEADRDTDALVAYRTYKYTSRFLPRRTVRE